MINPNPEGVLFNTISFEPTDTDFNESILITLDNYFFNDELLEELNVCSIEDDDCLVNQTFEFSVDCYGTWFGNAFIDNWFECVEGLTGLNESWAEDCNGDCFGDAFIDDCGDCSSGNTGLEENHSDLGCGCFQPGPA